jgi:hypothetical protein
MMGHRGDCIQEGCFLNRITLSNIPAMFAPRPIIHPSVFQLRRCPTNSSNSTGLRGELA